MTKNDMLTAMNGISEEYIEASEQKAVRGRKPRVAVILAAALMLALSVTAVAAASFFNTVNDGKLVFMEAVGGYSGDVYKINFDIDVAEDAGLELAEYCVPMYLEETQPWVDVQGEAGKTYSVLVYDNYDENLFAIFTQYPAWNYDNGASIAYSVPAGTEVSEGVFEVDGEALFCINMQPADDGYRGDPFGTKVVFWSDGYNMFVLETRLNMDEEVLREIIRSVTKVDDIADYAIIVNQWEE
ncbi:MAG: hypothetical protein IJ306_04240 [Oscillospiraceae bacterium]|nr:hypothetical protein [Oscillospiraceae bacterium]